MTLYNSIGTGYNRTRQPDSRIVDKLISFLELPPKKIIADIGAGTGNYSNAIANRGYKVIAIEPSKTMQSQAQPHKDVSWVTAGAESIPLKDDAVDGAIVMLALHHFQDIGAGIKEINRINATGKMAIFAFEQAKIPDFWLADYFPYFIQDTLKTFPNTKEIAHQIEQITHRQVTVIPFLLPPDLSDLFAAAGWRKPEIYLEESVRQGISTFSKIPSREIKKGIEQLADDLDSGIWLIKYGHIKQYSTYDAGYRIFVVR
ncbi:MAG: class I SAM-dependent methyltransferase [Pleurocapsa sp.]